MFSTETTTRFEIVVTYDNGEKATFLELDFEAAMGKATSLGRLYTSREIVINEAGRTAGLSLVQDH